VALKTRGSIEEKGGMEGGLGKKEDISKTSVPNGKKKGTRLIMLWR